MVRNTFAEDIVLFLKNNNRRFFTENREDGRITFIFPVGLSNIPTLNLVLSVYPTGKCDMVSNVGNGKELTDHYYKLMLEKLCDLTNNFAFTSFSMDREYGDIRISMNFYVNDCQTGEMIERYIYTFSSICEDTIPEILTILWDNNYYIKEKEESDDNIDNELDSELDSELDLDQVDEFDFDSDEDIFCEQDDHELDDGYEDESGDNSGDETSDESGAHRLPKFYEASELFGEDDDLNDEEDVDENN